MLDVATGAGHTAFAFAPHVAKVTATDITEEMLAETRKLAKGRGYTNVKALTAKAEDLPFPDASFDLVVCRLAAHHFRKIGRFRQRGVPRADAWRHDRHRGQCRARTLPSFPGATQDELRHCASLFNAFKKLSDPSHVRCLGLLEWRTLLTECRLLRHP